MIWNVFVRKSDAYLVLLRVFLAKAADGGDYAQVIKIGGMQLVGQCLHITCDLVTMPLDFLQPLIGSCRWSVQSAVGLFQFHRQQRQPLADVVMQVSRDSAAFFLLGFDQLTAHLFECLLR
jgi:hypothetical protein